MFKGKHLCGLEKGVASNHMLGHGVLSLILDTPVAGFSSSACQGDAVEKTETYISALKCPDIKKKA